MFNDTLISLQALKTKDQYSCLSFFAKAAEIDELGCTWKQQFEKKLEQISDFFTLPPKDDVDKYQSMLAEAYLVVLLHTVVSSQGGQDKDFEEVRMKARSPFELQ